MGTIIGLIGIVFLLSGFLSVAKVTDVLLTFVSQTQIQTLPLLNTIPAGWCFMLVGLILMGIGGAFYSRRRSVVVNENL